MKFAFFGSSLVSAYWNGAATYYRGIIRAMNERGHLVTFYEPDAYDRQRNRDIADPEWAIIRVYEPTEKAVYKVLEEALDTDVIVKQLESCPFGQLRCNGQLARRRRPVNNY